MGQQQTEAGSALRRMVLVLAIAAVMALLVTALAAPAFAVSNNGKGSLSADQVGAQASGVNQPDSGNGPGRGGQVTRDEAQSDASDPGIGDFASTHHHTRL